MAEPVKVTCPLCGNHVLGTSGRVDPMVCEFFRVLASKQKANTAKATVH